MTPTNIVNVIVYGEGGWDNTKPNAPEVVRDHPQYGLTGNIIAIEIREIEVDE